MVEFVKFFLSSEEGKAHSLRQTRPGQSCPSFCSFLFCLPLPHNLSIYKTSHNTMPMSILEKSLVIMIITVVAILGGIPLYLALSQSFLHCISSLISTTTL